MAVDRYGRKISSAEAKRRAGYRSDLQFRSADAISGGRAGELKKRASYRKAAGTKAATTKTRSVAAKGTRKVAGKKTYTNIPKPTVTNPRGTPGAVSGKAKSNWNKRQRTAQQRRSLVTGVATAATGNPIPLIKSFSRTSTGRAISTRVPSPRKISKTAWSWGRSAASSAEKWWSGY